MDTFGKKTIASSSLSYFDAFYFASIRPLIVKLCLLDSFCCDSSLCTTKLAFVCAAWFAQIQHNTLSVDRRPTAWCEMHGCIENEFNTGTMCNQKHKTAQYTLINCHKYVPVVQNAPLLTFEHVHHETSDLNCESLLGDMKEHPTQADL